MPKPPEVLIAFFKEPDDNIGSWKIVGDELGHYDALSEVLDELQHESDRGTAIVAAAVLDGLLKDLLLALFQNHDKEKECFSGNGPLATFSSRINLAYSLGIISKEEQRTLNCIRKVRNDFAHIRRLNFDTPAIADRCRSLDYARRNQETDCTRHVFLNNSIGLIFQLFDRPNEIKSKRPNLEVRRTVEEFFSG